MRICDPATNDRNTGSAIATSKLCQPDTWPLDIDEMVALYDSEINVLLDLLLPRR